MAGLFVSNLEVMPFLSYYLWWHLGLYSGATAFNSYWDKDEGPIGGIHHPPPMAPWMWYASWVWMLLPFMVLILDIAQTRMPMTAALIYASSLFLFWAYSSPHTRWKGRPYLSVFVIAISTGTNGFFMGYIAGGGAIFAANNLAIGLGLGDANNLALESSLVAEGAISAMLPFLAAFGVALILISFYPISQLFQFEEDQKRNDRTLAMHIGIRGVRRYYLWTYSLGLILVALALILSYGLLGALFLVGGSFGGILTYKWLLTITGEASEYTKVMRIKYVSALSFLSYILSMIAYQQFL